MGGFELQMELDLRRVDYLQVASVSRGTLQLLASQKSGTQKVVVGDDTGAITCFAIKKGEVANVFTSPAEEFDKAVGRVVLGGKDLDKIFVACGQTLKGLTKKGKEFFRFNANLSEDVKAMVVNNVDGKIYTGGNRLYHEFVDCKDANYSTLPDVINDIIVAPLTKDPATGHVVASAIIACQDRCVRVLRGSEVVYEVPLDGCPQCLVRGYWKITPGSGTVMAYYGTDDGTLGQILLEPDGGVTGWTLNNVRKLGGVTSIAMFDFTHDDKEDLVVGRDDGTIEAITFDEEMPKLLFSVNVNECVMTVAAGHITDPGRDEIIATTFSGKVIGFVARPEGDDGAASPAGQSEAKVTSVRSELEDLHKQLAEKKETLNSFSGPGIIPVQAAFKVHEKMMLGEDAMWNLNLEIEFPIEFVTLQSDIELEIMQEPNDTAVLSHCDPSPEEGNLMVATYSCVETSSRLNLKIRMIEGQMGMLRAYIIPSSSGGQGKVCQCSSFKIKPLSLHRRAHSADLSNHILSEIRVEGTFSVAEVHSWISNCLPEMPDRAADDNNEVIFQSTFVETVLCCQYRKNEAVFLSDSISALSVLKEVISREATQKKARISIKADIKDESVLSMLEMVHPKLEHQHTLARQFNMIQGLKELALQEPTLDFLTPEYQAILGDADKIQAEYKEHPTNLEYLHGVVAKLFVDKHKFKGDDARPKVPALHQLLSKYDFMELVNFFVTQGV